MTTHGRYTGRLARSRIRLLQRSEAKEKARDVVVPETLLAYCAGVIDSDGTIGVTRSTYRMRIGEAKSPKFFERVDVKQVTPEAIDLLKALFGGTRRLEKPIKPGRRPLYSWRATEAGAAACLRAILPHLRIKRVQAENCIALHELKQQSRVASAPFGRGSAGAIPRPQHLTEAMEFCYAAAKMLNTVGVQAATLTPLEAAQ